MRSGTRMVLAQDLFCSVNSSDRQTIQDTILLEITVVEEDAM